MQVGFCTLLTMLFVGLKLTDNIDWSWGWVLAPLWISAIVGVIVVVVVLAKLPSIPLGATWGRRSKRFSSV